VRALPIVLMTWLLAGTAIAADGFEDLAQKQDTQIRIGDRDAVLREARDRAEKDASLVNRLLLARLLPKDEALSMLSAAAREAPEDPDVLIVTAEVHLAAGKARNAEREARKLEDLAPKDPRGPHLIGLALVATGQERKAEGFFREALRRSPDRPASVVALGFALHALDRSAEGVEVVRTSAEKTKHPETFIGLGDLHFLRKEPEEAIAAYTKVMGSDAWRPDALIKRGYVAFRSGDPSKAISDLSQAASLRPHSYTARLYLGVALQVAGKTEEARATLSQATEIDRGRPEAPTRLAWLDHKEGNDRAAERSLKAIVKSYDDYVPARVFLSRVLSAKGDLNGARKVLKDVLKIDREHFEAHLNLARLSLQLGKAPEAYKYAKIAVDLDERNPEAVTLLGQVYFEMKKHDSAREALLVAIDLDARNAVAHRTLGEVYEAKEAFEEAAGEYDKAIAIDPEDAFARYLAGMLAAQMGENDKAIGHLQAYLNIVGEDRDVESVLGQLEGGG
jgi:tetratricopeptide (TPR) repeat protein